MIFYRSFASFPRKILRPLPQSSSLTLALAFTIFFLFFPTPAPSSADEILDTIHSHYRDQVQRIREALESGKSEEEEKETLSDARRTVRWIFEEPEASQREGQIIDKRVSKEFLELGIPVVIHPVPARPFILQRFTDHSIRLTNFEKGTILVKTSLPFLQDGKMKKARTEAILLAALLLREQILSLPVRAQLPVRKDLPPEALLLHGPLASTILNRAITRQGFSVKILPLAAGGGLVLVRMEIPLPLHVGGALASRMANLSFSSTIPAHKELNRHIHPTGLILDARALKITPFRDVMIASDEGYILMKPNAGRDSGSPPLGWGAFTDTLSPDILAERVGAHPLTIRPVTIAHHQVFLLSKKDARTVSDLFLGTPLLSTGHILIRLASNPLGLSPRSSSPSFRRKK